MEAMDESGEYETNIIIRRSDEEGSCCGWIATKIATTLEGARK